MATQTFGVDLKTKCGPKVIIKISLFFYSNLIILLFMFCPLDIINTSSYDLVNSNLPLGYF